MTTSNKLIKITNNLQIVSSGDIEKIPTGDSIFGKSFLQYNNQFVKSNYDENYSFLVSLVKQIPAVKRIFENIKSSKTLIPDLSDDQLKAIKKGTLYFGKSNVKDGNYTFCLELV